MTKPRAKVIPLRSQQGATADTDAHAGHEILHPPQQTVPIVFASPHSGRHYPKSFVEASWLDLHNLRQSEDCFVDELFAAAPDFGAPLIRAHFPRSYVDVNREPFELDPRMFVDRLPGYVNTQSPRVAAGLGTIPRVVGNGQAIYRRRLEFAEAKARIEACYNPFHDDLKSLLEQTRDRFGFCLLVDCHSMPSMTGMPPQLRGRFDFVIGDFYGASCDRNIARMIEGHLRQFGYGVHRNTPYAGGYVTRHYGRPRQGIQAVQLEVNRALYMRETTLSRHRGFDRIRERMTSLIAMLTSSLGHAAAAE
ncbi:MAG: N-formylglutamate amidohydrolase [Alphaproteobacteria bacterium]